jgi:hypothetical protein
VSLYWNLRSFSTSQSDVEHYKYLLGGRTSIGATNICDCGNLNLAGTRPIFACGNLVVDRDRDAADIYIARVGDYLFGDSGLCRHQSPPDANFALEDISICQ